MYLKSLNKGLCFMVIKASFYFFFLMHLNLIILTKTNLEHNTHHTIFYQKNFLFKKDIQKMKVTNNSPQSLKDLARDNLK